jgi:hypothetical protein
MRTMDPSTQQPTVRFGTTTDPVDGGVADSTTPVVADCEPDGRR